ncbi:dTMP kinase [Aeromicrobium sp. 50.2.37]|uniref:dTMP kinase n=1 Tax=Aeromicrobium sp. 50.2.37 TaxID=2969305 RepID=UPI00214F748C|nr:dTMP kinase [Aeromicrobium sp. 50.2.37]MCR4513648.1 dTMP kinase [Aeromicrobium sp. 50.2.37]
MQPRYTDSGVFIALEGGEGGGKSTQSRLLHDWLTAQGTPVLLTREPGGTEVGARLRSIVLDPATGDLSPRTEALVYAADKAEHVDAVVLPALERGEVVVTDRYVDSTLAYQGAGRAIDAVELEHVARWATADLRPHLTVVLDLDPRIGLSRAGEPDRIEAEPLDFHQRVREHFLALAAADPAHYLVLDADQPPEVVHAAIRAAVEPWLGQARQDGGDR